MATAVLIEPPNLLSRCSPKGGCLEAATAVGTLCSDWIANLPCSLTVIHISQPVYGARPTTFILQIRNLRDSRKNLGAGGWDGPWKGESEDCCLRPNTEPWDTWIYQADFKQWPFRQSFRPHPSWPRELTAAASLKEILENQREVKVLWKVWKPAQLSLCYCYAVNYYKVISGWQLGLF